MIMLAISGEGISMHKICYLLPQHVFEHHNKWNKTFCCMNFGKNSQEHASIKRNFGNAKG